MSQTPVFRNVEPEKEVHLLEVTRECHCLEIGRVTKEVVAGDRLLMGVGPAAPG